MQRQSLNDFLNVAADAKTDSVGKAGIAAAVEDGSVELTRQLLQEALKQME